jgi:hypothetical protein
MNDDDTNWARSNDTGENVQDFRNCGLVKDGVVWIWEEAEQRMVPVTESSRASAWARLQQHLSCRYVRV